MSVGIIRRTSVPSRTSWYSKWNPPADCVFWVPGQDDAQSGIIRDRSGYGSDGTIAGATWERNDKGLHELLYDGINDKVTLSDAGAGSPLNFTTQDFTIRVWITMTNLPVAEATSNTVGIRGTLNVDGWFLMYPHSNDGGVSQQARFLISQAAAFQDVRSGDALPYIAAGVPHMLTAIRSGNTAIFYVNTTSLGLSLGGGTIIDPVSSVTATVLGIWGAAYPQDGRMTLMALHNRALSATEVAGFFRDESHLFGV